jgi:hypothetical protein
VNKPAQGVGRRHSEQPHDHQDYEDGPKHRPSFLKT